MITEETKDGIQEYSEEHSFCDVELSEDLSQDFELINTKAHYDSRYGKVSYTREDLEMMAKQFNENILEKRVPVNIDHQRDKDGAEAWIVPNSMYVAQSRIGDGFSLYAKLEDFTPDMEKKVREKRFRYPSLEIGTFKKYVGDKLTTFSNVIVGLAFTNFPVIKGLDTMFAENANPLTPTRMLSTVLQAFSDKPTLSKSEKEVLATVVAQYSEEEQAENQEAIDAISSKEEPAEEAQEAEEEAQEEQALSEEVLKTLSEKDLEIQKLSEALAEKESALKEKALSEVFDTELSLSEDSVGFLGDDKEKVLSFMRTLSEEQLKEFSEIVKSVKSVDFKEYGSQKSDEELSEAQAIDEIKKYSEELQRQGVPQLEAIGKAVEKFSK